MPFWTKKEPQAPQTTAFDGAWAGTEKFGPVKLASCDLRDGQQSVIDTNEDGRHGADPDTDGRFRL